VRGALLLLVAGLALAACSPAEQSVAGIVTGIDTLGLGEVRGFTLRAEDGTSLEFTIDGGTDLAAGGFPPDHLREHMTTATPVSVTYHTEGDARVAVRLTDADLVGE
jgi:hypothetical protein